MEPSHPPEMPVVDYRVSPPVDSDALNALFAAAWEYHEPRDFSPVLSRSLAYICAYSLDTLIGFVNIAWDGGVHAFLLDPTVHAGWQRRGIGRRLVREAIAAATAREIEWLHVDYEPQLDSFYRSCGFQPTLAGLVYLPAAR